MAALNGTAAGGGYELALACEEIVLIDDGNSAVSFPEAPLLAVLPGTGGLTRLVDKRRVRRDLADVFSTIAEGIKGKRAKQWNLVDEVVPRSKWSDSLEALKARTISHKENVNRPTEPGQGISLGPVAVRYDDSGLHYKFLRVSLDPGQGTGELTILGPETPQPESGEAFLAQGAAAWIFRFFRELDDALVRLRFEFPRCGLLSFRSEGDIDAVIAADRGLLAAQDHWLGREILHFIRRTLKRLDLTARSLFTFVESGSCFGGSLLEVALASDRIYMLNDPDRPTYLAVSGLNEQVLKMATGLTRLEARFLGTPEQIKKVLEQREKFDVEFAEELGLITYAPDELDWEDEVRIAVEERANFSPDAMTGMEANLRFVGPETMETKIFGRLSAWQNWIFQRPNAVGEQGALTLYGKQRRPVFDMTRT